ncbi:helix-turn-helix transcriptional regulator [Acinetobacter sp. B5B]|uniref:S24 family peptidase n=1 Tax=Acinetobacter baretiae TaxID=2605383 RepID=UPI0018C23510|nr:S24 family peptidase [Acinetobacter baretiae]MBF7683009.1 helix-turn-helix transcriptional regulator [Acinetobacter baretiae]
MEVADRINQKMQELGLSQADLLRATGAGRATISGWVNGTNKPSAKHIGALAQTLKVTEGWILYGIKENIILDTVKVWDENTPLEEDEVEVPFFKDFSFACGYGSICDIEQKPTEKLRLPKVTLRSRGIQYNQSVAAMASGESMSPTIKDGDTVHIDLGKKTVKDGKVFAICHGGLFMIKRLYNLPMGGIRVVSDNTVEFPELRLTAQEIVDQQFEIVGWIWQIASLENW